MAFTNSIFDKSKQLFGFDTKQDSKQLKNKIDALSGKNNASASENSVNRNYNPFVNQKTGRVINEYADYKPLISNSKTNGKVKEWLSEATGIQPSVTSKDTADTATQDNVGFDASLDGSSLGGLDVATQLPKLSTTQIAKIINTHFSNSPVISSSDADGIYNAQKNTGMSALAILGIGALESGYGTSSIAKQTNNIWGYGATNINPAGNAHRYSQMSQGANQFASEFMKTYYNGYGAKTINAAGTGNNPKGMGYAYTDSGQIDSSWATQVSDIMGTLYNTAKTVSDKGSYTTSKGSSNVGRNIVNAAKSYLGTPYVWGGTSSSGVDCSGLVQLAAKASGIDVPRTTYEQIKVGKAVDRNNLQEGDLVFFKGSGGSSAEPGHVGIYVGNGQYIQAPRSGEVVKISDLSQRSDYVGARRLG